MTTTLFILYVYNLQYNYLFFEALVDKVSPYFKDHALLLFFLRNGKSKWIRTHDSLNALRYLLHNKFENDMCPSVAIHWLFKVKHCNSSILYREYLFSTSMEKIRENGNDFIYVVSVKWVSLLDPIVNFSEKGGIIWYLYNLYKSERICQKSNLEGLWF